MRDRYQHWSDISYTHTQQLLRDTLATQVSQHCTGSLSRSPGVSGEPHPAPAI